MENTAKKTVLSCIQPSGMLTMETILERLKIG